MEQKLKQNRTKFRIYKGYKWWCVRIFDGSGFWQVCWDWETAIDEMYREIARRGWK